MRTVIDTLRAAFAWTAVATCALTAPVWAQDLANPRTQPAALRVLDTVWTSYAFVFEHPETPPLERRPVEPLLSTVSKWVAAEMGAPNKGAVPRVEFVSTDKIVELRYRALMGDAEMPHSVLSYAKPVPNALAMFYDDALKTIYLSDLWTGGSPAELSLVVRGVAHHHIQNLTNLAFGCPEERQKLAFATQNAWLAQFGRSIRDDFTMDEETYLLSTECVP